MNRFRKKNEESKASQSDRTPPLREFKHDSSRVNAYAEKGSGRDWNRIRMYWSLFGLFAISILLVVATWIYPDSEIDVSNEALVEEDEPVDSPELSENLEAPELLNAYLNALGGRQAVEAIQSIRYEGQVIFPSGQSDFQMFLLRPGKGMLITNRGEGSGQKLVLNGDTAWHVLDLPNGAREVMLLDDENMAALKWSFRVHNTFRRIALEGRADKLTVREIEYMDRPCYEVVRSEPDASNLLAVLDKETLYLLKLEETLFAGEEKNRYTIKFDDYRMVSGVVEPYETKLYKNGEFDNEVEVRSIQINSGVMSSLFKVPDEFSNN